MSVRYQRLIRPATEAESLVVPITFGCSYGKCAFCANNFDKPFRVRDIREVKTDIDEVAAAGLPFKRVFLADGDALVVRHERLVEVLTHIRQRLPEIERVGIYGNAKDLLRKTPEQLSELRDLGLGLIYQGLESGDDAILEFLSKGCTAEQQIEAGRKVREAGILLSVTLVLGVGGERWREHAVSTAEALNRIRPSSIRVHTILVTPDTPLYGIALAGGFVPPDPMQTLEELRLLISKVDLWDTPLLANMKSNYLPLWGLLSNDRESLLARIDEVLSSRDYSQLRSEQARAV